MGTNGAECAGYSLDTAEGMANLRVRINIAAFSEAPAGRVDSLARVSFTVNGSRCSADQSGFRQWVSR